MASVQRSGIESCPWVIASFAMSATQCLAIPCSAAAVVRTCAIFLPFLVLRLDCTFGSFSEQSPYLTCQFHQIERGCRPEPFGLDFLQPSQQELPKAHDRFENAQCRFGDPLTLLVDRFRGSTAHPSRSPLSHFFVFIFVSPDGAAMLRLGAHARICQGATLAIPALVRADGHLLPQASKRLSRFRYFPSRLRGLASLRSGLPDAG